jgi:hypothetical protein
MSGVARGLWMVLLGAAVSVLGVPAATAAEGGLLRLAHLSPDTPAVDVYVDSVADPDAGLVLTGVAYGTVSDYQTVPPGTYTVAMRTAGADPATPPALSATVEVGANTAWTVAGVGNFADLGLDILEDDLTLPPTGQARVRVIAAAATATTLDVSLSGGAELAQDLEFAGTSGYVDVPAGATSLQVTPEGGAATELPVQVAAGSVYSVIVLDAPGGGLAVQPALDAASPGVVPVGGVDTGAGGTAAAVAGTPGLVALAALGVAALGMAVLLGTGRARLPRHAPARRPVMNARDR